MDRRLFLTLSSAPFLSQINMALAQTLSNPNSSIAGTNSQTEKMASLSFRGLRPSEKMPVIFLGHGSPMNAIEDNDYRRSWVDLGEDFGVKYPKPQLILCVSAHWLTPGKGWFLTGQANPPTIHDFGGFPAELFAQQYPASGAPETAQDIASVVSSSLLTELNQFNSTSPKTQQLRLDYPLQLESKEWGYDHGTWSVLKPMFPKADIPVVQLSMDYARAPADHYQLAQQLQVLRGYGVLIVGSGNIVHNLRLTQRGTGPQQTYDWASEFDARIKQAILNKDFEALVEFQRLGNIAQLAQPSWDHYLPLLYTLGAAGKKAQPNFFNESFQLASISMRSVIWIG